MDSVTAATDGVGAGGAGGAGAPSMEDRKRALFLALSYYRLVADQAKRGYVPGIDLSQLLTAKLEDLRDEYEAGAGMLKDKLLDEEGVVAYGKQFIGEAPGSGGFFREVGPPPVEDGVGAGAGGAGAGGAGAAPPLAASVSGFMTADAMRRVLPRLAMPPPPPDVG